MAQGNSQRKRAAPQRLRPAAPRYLAGVASALRSLAARRARAAFQAQRMPGELG